MKHRSIMLFAILTVVLLVASFAVGRASATTGCFTDTNGHWAEVAICWMAENGITSGIGGGLYSPEGKVTRAQMAVFMKKVDELAITQMNSAISDAVTAMNNNIATSISNALSSGTTFEMSGLNNWRGYGDGSSYVQYYRNADVLRAPAAGTYAFTITPDIPGSLFNHQMFLKGVKLCYDATHGATLSYVDLEHIIRNAGQPYLYNQVTDSTGRTDNECREYMFSTPGDLVGTDHVVLYIEANFPGAADQLYIQSTSFILSPSHDGGYYITDESRRPRPNDGSSAPSGSGPDN
jgi:hypothetical protein